MAAVKMRDGMPIGAKGHPPGRAYVRVPRPPDRVAVPRIRDFRGSRRVRSTAAATIRLGFTEQIIFPEINYDDIQQVRGLDVTITTSAETDDHARALLQAFGLPFSAEAQKRRD